MSGGVFGPGGPGPTSPWSVISRASLGDHVPVAGLLRVSTEDLQDPRGSLLRQVGNCVRALPAGWSVVAWFIDIESGRMELDQRGTGTAHLNIDLPVDRDGGLPDLLAEAKRPGCRFAAVICENAERLARYTYFNTKIEYELGKTGIELFASDEPIDPEGKKAAKVLVRRIKQAVGEWTAINTFEMAWDGLKTHTESGYNIGRAPYGYRTKSHTDGTRTKSVLVVHDKEGPVVTQIFRWRIDHRLNNRQIVAKLNKDLTLYPPPTPGTERHRCRTVDPLLRPEHHRQPQIHRPHGMEPHHHPHRSHRATQTQQPTQPHRPMGMVTATHPHRTHLPRRLQRSRDHHSSHERRPRHRQQQQQRRQ